jgi:hypothetical protein
MFHDKKGCFVITIHDLVMVTAHNVRVCNCICTTVEWHVPPYYHYKHFIIREIAQGDTTLA